MAVIISSNSGKWHYAIKRFVCDVAADVQDLPIDGVWPGSTAYVVDTCETYMFNGNKEWIKITCGSGGGGGGGSQGLAATIQVGNVTTGQPGSEVTITNSGTESAAVFDFSIPRGEPFQIKKVYDSIQAMEADYNNPDINVGDLVAIVSDPQDPDNATLYVKGDTQFEFFMDLSGAQGIQGPAGPKGEKGDAFTYGDFSPAQLEGLRGPAGRGISSVVLNVPDYTLTFTYTDSTTYTTPSVRGPKGDAFTYDDFTPEQLEALTGPQGPEGPEGNGIDDITQNPDGTITITLDDGEHYDVEALQGEQGERGPIGPAFTYSDFTNTQLEALKGEDGVGIQSITLVDTDTIRILLTNNNYYDFDLPAGPKGDQGDGLVIYKVYADTTEMNADKANVPEGKIVIAGTEVYVKGATDYTFIVDMAGLTGIQGPKGDKGDKGDPFVYSDFTPEQLAALTGPAGADGAQPKAAAINENGQLTLTLTDESKVTTPQSVVGPQGLSGMDGATGVGIVSVQDLGEGQIKVILSDGSYYSFNIATIAGPTGATGPQGPQGVQGIQGEQGDPLTWDDLTPEQKDALTGAQGATGAQGPAGAAGTISIGTVTAGTTPSVTNVGTPQNAVLNIVLPVGESWGIHEVYETLSDAEADIGNIPEGALIMLANTGATNGNVYVKDGNALIYLTNLAGAQGIEGPAGPAGANGRGISGVALNPDGTITVTYTDGTTSTTVSALQPAGFNTRGEWTPNTAYVNSVASGIDIVSYEGASYACVTSHTSSSSETPDTSNKWMLIANGSAGTIEVGTVTTGPQVSVTNVGTPQNAIFNFTFPATTVDATAIPTDSGDPDEDTYITVVLPGQGALRKFPIDKIAYYTTHVFLSPDLLTEEKTIVGAINELKETLSYEKLTEILGLVTAGGDDFYIYGLDIYKRNETATEVLSQQKLENLSGAIRFHTSGNVLYGQLSIYGWNGSGSSYTITDTSTGNTKDSIYIPSLPIISQQTGEIKGYQLDPLPVPIGGLTYDSKQYNLGPCYAGTGGISGFRLLLNNDETKVTGIHGWIYGTIGPKRVDDIVLNRNFDYLIDDQNLIAKADYDYIHRLIIGDESNIAVSTENDYNLIVGSDNVLGNSDPNHYQNCGNIINGIENTLNTTYHSDCNIITGRYNSLTNNSGNYGNNISGDNIVSTSQMNYNKINGDGITITTNEGSWADSISGQAITINTKHNYRNNISGYYHTIKSGEVEDNLIAGNYTQINYSLSDEDTITGNFGFYQNTILGNSNSIQHYNDTTKVGYRISSNLIGGTNNTVQATTGDLYSSIIYGHQNTINQISGIYGLTTFGGSNTITSGSGNYSTIMGYGNTLQDGSAYTTILGNYNLSQSGSGHNFITGEFNTVSFSAQYNTVEGYQNTVSSIRYSHVEGKDNTVGGGFNNIHVQGLGHNFSSGGASQPISVLGQYSNADMTALEVVGNGTKNSDTITRSNARVLDINGNETLAGNLTIGGTPTNNNHAATISIIKELLANFADPYDSTVSYNTDDVVTYGYSLYKNTTPTTGDWDSTKWTKIKVTDLI